MKRRALIRKIQAAADSHGVPRGLVREGSRHEFWDVVGIRFVVPRHREINEWTAEGIMRDLEPILGTDWWRI